LRFSVRDGATAQLLTLLFLHDHVRINGCKKRECRRPFKDKREREREGEKERDAEQERDRGREREREIKRERERKGEREKKRREKENTKREREREREYQTQFLDKIYYIYKPSKTLRSNIKIRNIKKIYKFPRISKNTSE
jgi:hypothetical protein